MILKLWTDIFMLFRFNCHSFLQKKWTAFVAVSWRAKSINKAWIYQQRDLCRTPKCKLQSPSELHGMPGTRPTSCKHIVWNDSHSVRSFQASNSKHTYFMFTFIIAYCFGSTYIWSNYFGAVWLHDNFILQSFCITTEHSVSMMQKCGLDWTLDL